jgi:hypothetical protein
MLKHQLIGKRYDQPERLGPTGTFWTFVTVEARGSAFYHGLVERGFLELVPIGKRDRLGKEVAFGMRFRILTVLALIVGLISTTMVVSAQNTSTYDFAEPEFEQVWERTDYPVDQLEVARTWIWGPEPRSEGLLEEYAESPTGERLVQYFDKSRMEFPWRDGQDDDSPWYITQGLLAHELMTGALQVGDDSFIQYAPADIPVAGDPDDPLGPTYAVMGSLMGGEAHAPGDLITTILTSDGTLSDNPSLEIHGVTADYYIEETEHTIASVFWEFMNAEGLIYDDGDYVEDALFADPFYAIGFPITEAYWGWVKVDETQQNVLIQCFERHCLTYTPDNPDGWQVESGNIGLHYHTWRYHIVPHLDPIEPPVEISIELSPEEATNPHFTPQWLEVFEEEFEFWVMMEIGPEAWEELTEVEQADLIEESIPEFWETAIGHPAPNMHSVEAIVEINGEVVDSGAVDVTIEVDDTGAIIFDGQVDIEDGAATITYDVTDYADASESTDNTITVGYNGAESQASVTWVPILEYEYEQEPTYVFLNHYFHQLTLEPAGPVSELGEWHDVIATVLDQFGQPIEDENLTLSITGANENPTETTSYDPEDIDTVVWEPDPWEGLTNENGQRAFSYIGEHVGEDVVTVTIESDTELSESLTIEWVEPEE